MFIYTIIIILLINIDNIHYYYHDTPRSRFCLTPLPWAVAAAATIRRNGCCKDSVAKGSPKAERTKAMPLGTFANRRRLYGCTSGLLWQSKPAIWAYIIWTYMNYWGMSSETRKKKFRKQNKMHTKGTRYYSSSKPAHWKNPTRKKHSLTALPSPNSSRGPMSSHRSSQLEYEL